MLPQTLFLATLLSVTDGDTFQARVEVWPAVHITTAVRLAGIDTPELRGKCAAERTAAQAARKRLAELLQGEVVIYKVQPDKYAGRIDAAVLVAGQDIAATLVSEGHARPYTGGARAGWC